MRKNKGASLTDKHKRGPVINSRGPLLGLLLVLPNSSTHKDNGAGLVTHLDQPSLPVTAPPHLAPDQPHLLLFHQLLKEAHLPSLTNLSMLSMPQLVYLPG